MLIFLFLSILMFVIGIYMLYVIKADECGSYFMSVAILFLVIGASGYFRARLTIREIQEQCNFPENYSGTEISDINRRIARFKCHRLLYMSMPVDKLEYIKVEESAPIKIDNAGDAR